MGSKTTRAWLNPTSANTGACSFVLTDIDDSRGEWGEHNLTIHDCNRQITLDFPADKKGRKKALTKLGKLYDALNLIEEALEDNDD